jgi:hypothetical protein
LKDYINNDKLKNEYNTYLTLGTSEFKDFSYRFDNNQEDILILYWKKKSEIKDSILPELALRVLGVPVSSAETERSFSTLNNISDELNQSTSKEKTLQELFIKINYFRLFPPDDRNDENKNQNKVRIPINKKNKIFI